MRDFSRPQIHVLVRSDGSIKDIRWTKILDCGHQEARRAKLREGRIARLPTYEDFIPPPAKVKCRGCLYLARYRPMEWAARSR